MECGINKKSNDVHFVVLKIRPSTVSMLKVYIIWTLKSHKCCLGLKPLLLVSLPAGLKVKCGSPKHNLLVHIGLVSYHIMVHTSWSQD